MSLLAARNLTKSYGSRQVVKDVSLWIESGEVVGLLGPNGAGKTTSFNMIVGFIASDSGRILLDEEDITFHPIDLRARLGIGYLPQEASVFRKLTVEENLLAVLEVNPEFTEEERLARADALLEEFHLAHLRDNLGASLSGGERRRTEIARALATEPRFLLLDEPFAGVDPISVHEIQRIVRSLSEMRLGILITDHNVSATLRICDRAYIVDDGRTIARGTAEEIVSNVHVRDVYLGSQFEL